MVTIPIIPILIPQGGVIIIIPLLLLLLLLLLLVVIIIIIIFIIIEVLFSESASLNGQMVSTYVLK